MKCIISWRVSELHFGAVAAGDEVAIGSALERYEDIDMNFAGSREAKLLKARSPLHNDVCLITPSPAPRLLLACFSGEACLAW